MAWTTPRTWVANEVPTAATFNAHVRDNLDYLYDQAGQSYPAEGRLTLTSGAPFTAADALDKTTLYYTPDFGTRIALYNGTDWDVHTFTEISLNCSAYTASTPYDIFVYNNGGTITLDGTAWTNATTRATSIERKNGVYCKTGALTYRFLGMIYVDLAQKLQDANAFRYVCNFYNRVQRLMTVAESTSHTYNGAARLWNNSNTNNQINWITCHSRGQTLIGFYAATVKAGADASYARVLLYINGGATSSPLIASVNYNNNHVTLGNSLPISVSTGFNYLNLYETGNHASSTFDSMTMGAWGEF